MATTELVLAVLTIADDRSNFRRATFMITFLCSTTETEHKMESRLLLDVVVRKGAAVLELLAREDETLLIGGDALLVLDLALDHVDGVRGLDLEGDGLAGKGLHEDLHLQKSQQFDLEEKSSGSVIGKNTVASMHKPSQKQTRYRLHPSENERSQEPNIKAIVNSSF